MILCSACKARGDTPKWIVPTATPIRVAGNRLPSLIGRLGVGSADVGAEINLANLGNYWRTEKKYPCASSH